MKPPRPYGQPGPWWSRIVIGDPACPLIHRWELVKLFGFKLMVHHFLPGSDRDYHDHPRCLLAICLHGSYLDLERGGQQRVIKPGVVRLVRPSHAHLTKVSDQGCWTVVFAGRDVQTWGFWRGDQWLPWTEYLERFGQKNMRCP